MRKEGPEGVLFLAELYAPIADDLRRAQQVFADELVCDQGFISDLCHHVGQFHGKSLRPALVLLSARATGSVCEAHHTLAAVVEMVHIATLVHDDVLDEADIRRRAATVNRLWGNERAVLMGDFLISHAYHLCSSVDSQFASRLIAATTNTVCEGEMMQVANRENYGLDEGEYLDIITRKTASLIGACCQLGAHFAGASSSVTSRMYAFGVALGVAFQIVDDVLDLTGDESEVGKSLGRDVHKGKLTLPVIHYLREASPAQREALLHIVRDDADPARHRRVARLLREFGSIEYAEDAARARVASAEATLAELPASDARDSLQAMTEFVLARRQ